MLSTFRAIFMLIRPFNTFLEFKFSLGWVKKLFWFFLYATRVVGLGQIPPVQVPTTSFSFGANWCLLGSGRTGWRWKQHLNCPCAFKPAFSEQGSGIWSLCCAFWHVQTPNLSLLGSCKIAIMNLVFFLVCFIKVVSRQTIEYSHVLKCYNFLLNWFGCAVSASTHSISVGVPAGQATSTLFFQHHAHWGGFSWASHQ